MDNPGTAHDRHMASLAAGIAAIALGVAILVIAATDEGGPWSLRLGLAAALGPVAGTLGAVGAMRLAGARGELRALAAVGVEPLRAVRGAVAGGVAMGLLGPLAAASGLSNLAALFPRPAGARRWIVDGAGLHETTLGLRVGPHGLFAVETSSTPTPPWGALPGSAAAFAVAALAGAAIVCPLWFAAAEGSSPGRRAAVGALGVMGAIAAFQLVAAGRVPPAALLAAPLGLLIDVAAARYGARRT